MLPACVQFATVQSTLHTNSWNGRQLATEGGYGKSTRQSPHVEPTRHKYIFINIKYFVTYGRKNGWKPIREAGQEKITNVIRSESECKCLTCNQKPTGSQFSLMGVDFYSTLGGPLIEAPKAPMSNAEGVRIEAPRGVGCGV